MPNSLYVPPISCRTRLQSCNRLWAHRLPSSACRLRPSPLTGMERRPLLHALVQVSGERLEHACWLSFTEPNRIKPGARL
jgi:hypothetical protein